MTILFAWLLADFISGLVHWWEDRAIVGASRFEFINGVRADNERHHRAPAYLLRYSWWENINTTAPIAWTLALLLFLLEAPAVLVLTTVFVSVGNLIHRFAHEPWHKRSKFMKFMNKTGLFISYWHHAGHHLSTVNGKLVSREESRRRYCVMTNWLNPVLDGIGFFPFLERIFRLGSK